jgi:DNA-binding SARP family transcriptional activator
VLAHLLIRANQVVSTDLLIDEIWGDEPPEAARPSLYSYVSHLKKALGTERLVARPGGYLLRAGADEIDAARFERLVLQGRRRLSSDAAAASRTLREAHGLWHGQPFSDHDLQLLQTLGDDRTVAEVYVAGARAKSVL